MNKYGQNGQTKLKFGQIGQNGQTKLKFGQIGQNEKFKTPIKRSCIKGLDILDKMDNI